MNRVSVAVLGPGRVGTTLALALPRATYRVVAVAGRSAASVDAFCRRVPSARPMAAADAARAADLVLVTVPDDALVTVVRGVAADDGVREGSRWVHTAGGYDHLALRPARFAGARIAACHPAQTFPEPDAGLAVLPHTAWGVTADDNDLAWACALVTDLDGTPLVVPASGRTLYHAALAVGSNGTASVVTLARNLLLAAGVEDPAAFLRPLVTASADNAAQRGVAALTGPVRRGDVGTIDRHLRELAAVLPEALDAYLALARLALAHARRAGLDPQRAAAVAERLDAGTRERAR